MIEYNARLKSWGNSLGIIVPKEKSEGEHLKINQEVKVVITPKKMLRVKDIFGKLKNWKRSTEDIMKDVDRELDSKFLKH